MKQHEEIHWDGGFDFGGVIYRAGGKTSCSQAVNKVKDFDAKTS